MGKARSRSQECAVGWRRKRVGILVENGMLGRRLMEMIRHYENSMEMKPQMQHQHGLPVDK